jgi:ankyrin repeat protein
MVSAYNGHPDIVEKLIKKGAEVNILNEVSITELQYLISRPLQ